jgi:AcrR family transcriptional regulator
MPTSEVDAPAATEKITPSRERILLAGKHLFARNGYENASTVAIAREAGTSESQLMKHFGSKQGLLTAIIDRGWDSILDRVQAMPANIAGAERLFRMLESVAVEMEHDLELKELMTLESRRVRKDGRDVLVSRGCRHFSESLDLVLSDMRGTGQLRSDLNLDAVRVALMGIVESLLREEVIAARSDSRTGYGFQDLRVMLELFLPALQRDARPSKFANG